MKKIICTVSFILLALLLSACGNHSIGLGSYTFEKVHIADHAGNCQDAIVEKWYENDTGIELKTREYGSMFLSEGTYILYNGKCPICGK